MAKITIIDDDFALEALVQRLQTSGHDAIRYRDGKEALQAISTIKESDLVIIDLMMERPEGLGEAATRGGFQTGLAILRELRKLNPDLRAIVHTASQEVGLKQEIGTMKNTTFLPKWTTPRLPDFLELINRMLGTTTATATKVFIVHGRDMATAFEVKNYLQNTLKLPEPIILQEQPSYGRTIIEKFEDTARGCELVFVLLTPDDIMANTDASNDDKWRSRQNVIFEMGYFFGILGRLSGRVLLLHKGKIDLPSDIDGLVYIDITAGISAAGDTIRKEIKDVIS